MANGREADARLRARRAALRACGCGGHSRGRGRRPSEGIAEVAARFYDAMKDVGLTETRITLLWDSTHPTTSTARTTSRRRSGTRRPTA
jgi:hypothetical protein